MVKCIKSRLSFIINNDGFILVHVLFVISLTSILVMSSIASYHNEIYITERQIEQIELETLFQMGREKFKQELLSSPVPVDYASYEFPIGSVQITVMEKTETYMNLYFEFGFQNKPDIYNINHLMNVNFLVK